MMGHVILSGVSKGMTKPKTALYDLAEGSIVKINESGSPVEFYVANHNYESGLNGTGRTLLVRKDCYGSRVWNSTNVNAYASSTIDSFLNGDYKGLLDADVQSAIGTTKFYYTPGNGNTTMTTLPRSVFLLSVTELGKTAGSANTEGTALPIASALQIAYYDGLATRQWTRSPKTNATYSAYFFDSYGTVNDNNLNNSYGSRPCFTLPSTSKVSEDGSVIV